MAYIREKLSEVGIPKSAIAMDDTHKRSPYGGEVGNLSVKIPGTMRGPRRLLMAHADTVPICVGARPVRKGEYYYSRDSHTALGADDRAGSAAILHTLMELKRQKLPHPPLTFLWVVQEENGLQGVQYARTSKFGNPKLCFNWDGDRPASPVIGATGDYNMEIRLKGIASHAGVCPEAGISTIAIAGKAIADLVENGWHGQVVKGKKSGTSNIGYVNAGEATNVVTPELFLKAEVRSHDRTFRKRLLSEFKKAFERAVKSTKNISGQRGSMEFFSDLYYESFRLKESEPCVKELYSVIRELGDEPQPVIANGGLDANWMNTHGFPTVTIGCGQQLIHTTDERLHIESYLKSCQMGMMLATAQCS